MKIIIQKDGLGLFRLLAFLMILNPILTYYNLPGTTISCATTDTLITVILLLYMNYKYSFSLYTKDANIIRPYIFLSVYIFFVTIICNTIFDNFKSPIYILLSLMLETLKIYLLIKATSYSHDFSRIFIRIYLFFSIAISIITLIEELLYAALGIFMPVRIGFLPLTEDLQWMAYRFGYNARGSYIGFSPFFSEPSHMAQFLIPSLILILTDDKMKFNKKIFNLILVEAAIVISTSSFGILSSLIVVLFYLCLGKDLIAKRIRNLAFALLPALIVVFFLFMRGRLFYDSNTGVETFGTAKTSVRLSRGLGYYIQFPLPYQIFGIGFSNFSYFISAHGLHYINETIASDGVTEYLSGLSQSFVYGGVIGLFLLIDFLIRLFVSSDSEGKALTIGLILLYIATSTFLRDNSVLYIIIIFVVNSRKENNDCDEIF